QSCLARFDLGDSSPVGGGVGVEPSDGGSVAREEIRNSVARCNHTPSIPTQSQVATTRPTRGVPVMTAFTLLHTAVSVLPVGFGLAAFARHGGIDPTTRLGKWYVGTMLAGTVSGFGFLLTLGFTPGQVLGLVTLAL